MKFKKIQLLEYALSCLQDIVNSKNVYNEQIEFQMIIKSSNDIFRSRSLSKNKYNESELKNLSKNNDFKSLKIELYSDPTDLDNPYNKIRFEIHEIFNKVFHFDSLLLTDPELILPKLLKIVDHLDPIHDSIDIWYDYKSEIIKLNLDYNLDTSDDYTILWLDHVITGDK